MKILLQLQEMLKKYNSFRKLYQSIRERENGVEEIPRYTIVIKSDVDLRGRRLRQYDIPATAEVAGLIPGDPSINHRDIVMMHREPKEGSKYHRINETDAIYDRVCYPLIFPCGDLTWSYNTYDKLKSAPLLKSSQGS